MCSAQEHTEKSLILDVVLLDWSQLLYVFSPIPLRLRVIRKIWLDKANIILIGPMLSRQDWYPDLLHCVCCLSLQMPLATAREDFAS